MGEMEVVDITHKIQSLEVLCVNSIFLFVHNIAINCLKGLVDFQNKQILIIYSPSCHSRCSCLSFFSRKEMKVFEERIPGFFSI